MPITYDIETDYLYNKGKEKGIRAMLLNTQLSKEVIAQAMEVPLALVQKISKEVRG